MPVISGNDIAVSGMKAQRVRMNVIANNVANSLETRTEDGGPFRRQLAIFRGNQLHPLSSDDRYGVEVKRLAKDWTPFRQVFDPGHPDANDDGYVAYPNVDLSVEMVNLVAAERAYEANVAVFSSGKRMTQKALEIIQA